MPRWRDWQYIGRAFHLQQQLSRLSPIAYQEIHPGRVKNGCVPVGVPGDYPCRALTPAPERVLVPPPFLRSWILV